jgi:chorismate synthase
MSVQAIKGVEFGPAFENTRKPGTQVHDAIRRWGSDLVRPSDRSGGLEGGITTGQPLVIRAAMKPIASTLTPQQTVDLFTGAESRDHLRALGFLPGAAGGAGSGGGGGLQPG